MLYPMSYPGAISNFPVSHPRDSYTLAKVVGFEPTTRGFGDPCSGQTELHRFGCADDCIVAHSWLRERDLNPRPSGYGPDELTGLLYPALTLVAEEGVEPSR